MCLNNYTLNPVLENETVIEEPNTALFSVILMFLTFTIAYNLKLFKEGNFFTKRIRNAIGDFGVPIAILVSVLVDYFVQDVYTDKLEVPYGFQVTDPTKRGWLIHPIPENFPIWLPFAAFIPALLLYFLMFMGTEINELLMMEKTTQKGAGLHWDIVLTCGINCLGNEILVL